MSDVRCRILRGEREIYSSDMRGIAPIIQLIDDGVDVSGCVVYDKVVGRAAALLYVYLKVGKVCAGILSKKAADALDMHGIPYTCEKPVEGIINRKGDGPCPMEMTVGDISDPEIALAALRKKLGEMDLGKCRK